MKFPDGFTWGVSTGSYQIEGGASPEERGDSVWDMFCRRPGAIWRGQSGEMACDHYHRWAEDVELMRGLGVGAYRFSICWPRVLPEGVGAVNERGLDFYDRLIDALLNAGIEPWVCLFHWDYPTALFNRGGWLHADSSKWFADYTRVIAEKFSDRVGHWMTQNEPQCFIGLGHLTGEHAPGIQLPMDLALRAAHNSLLAHGRAVEVIRGCSNRDSKIGIGMAGPKTVPHTDGDLEAARSAFFDVNPDGLWNNAWWMDPVYKGCYPENGLRAYGNAAPDVADGDMKIISKPLDFTMVNVYNAHRVEKSDDGGWKLMALPKGFNRTSQDDWPVEPEGMYWCCRWLYEEYGLPVVVTENGHQNLDFVMSDGKVHDPQRIDFAYRYLNELRRAIEDGFDVRGYFHWTLLDNFEWRFGYKVRVGLVYTDFETLDRTPKDSYYWYRSVIESHGKALEQNPFEEHD